MRFYIALGTLLVATTPAVAVDGRVEAACERDYSAFCSQYDPDGKEVRRCMRANSAKLTEPCLEALLAAGEMTQEEVARYQRSKRSPR